MKKIKWTYKTVFLVLAVLCISLFSLFLKAGNDGGGYAITTSAASGDVMRIDRYDVTATVRTDRKIEFTETVVMTPQKAGSVFTRYLPLSGDRYYGISASCVGEESAFSYSVTTDDEDYYLCVDCKIPSAAGQTRTYKISYIMEIGTNDVENGMLLDIIGYGWQVALHNVTATLHFPAPVDSDFEVYSGGYGATGNEADVVYTLSEDGKTLTLTAETLDRVYNSEYGESMAEGVTVRFTFPEGTLDGFLKTRIFTDDIWKIVLGGAFTVALAVCALVFLRKKREIVTVVNIKAPDDMDPMRMGKLLDGNVDNEDITSMIYYFAYQGYLTIDLRNEDDPVLIRKVVSLPEDTPVYRKTLFNGLFRSGETVAVSQLKNNFYQSVDIAKKQVLGIPMYEKKSIFGFVSGGLLGILFALFVPFLIGKFKVGGGYTDLFGIAMAVPVALIVFIAAWRENYRYKWKKRTLFLTVLLQWGIAAIFTLIYTFTTEHMLTECEQLVVALFVFATTFLTLRVISRTEKYCETLGEILGFKEFIVVTEEDKIKFMLEDDPELYYKVLPYAQVLGVTDEWEKKFENILLQPPHWYAGGSTSYFDYMILNRCIARSMVIAMSRPQQSGNGSFAGRSGGGGRFGGFGGGGHGGGGGGWR